MAYFLSKIYYSFSHQNIPINKTSGKLLHTSCPDPALPGFS